MGSFFSQLFSTVFRFQNEYYLWLLIPCLLLPWLLRLLETRKNQQVEGLFSKSFLEEMVWRRFKNLRKIKLTILIICLASLLIALARPQWGAKEIDVPNSGLDIVFLLDLSRSMATEDVVPSRLKKAKHIIKNFLQRFASDRVAVVGFAGSSIPLVPMTTDYEYIEQVLEDVDENYIVNQGTDYKTALESALQMIERGGENSSDPNQSEQKNRIVILISDGESHVGAERDMYSVLKDSGVVGFSIGVGSFRGGPIPVRDSQGMLQGYKKDRGGANVVSMLQEAALKEFAQSLGGSYFLSTTDESEVDSIYQQLVSGAKNYQTTSRVRQYNELYQIFILISVLLLFYAFWLPDAKKLIQFILIGSVCSCAFPQHLLAQSLNLPNYLRINAIKDQLAKIEKKSNDSKNDADSEKAELDAIVSQLKDIQVEYPDNGEVQNLLATALQKNKNFIEAAGQYELQKKSKMGEEALKAQFNAAQAWKEAKNISRAQGEFQDLLDKIKAKPNRTPDEEALLKEVKKAVQTSQNQSGNQGNEKDKSDQDKNSEQDNNKEENEKNKNKDRSGSKQDADNKKDDTGEHPEKEKSDQKPGKQDKQDKQDKTGKLQERHQNQFKSQSLSENDAKSLLQQLREQDKGTQRKVKINKQGDKRGKDDEQKISDTTGQDW